MRFRYSIVALIVGCASPELAEVEQTTTVCAAGPTVKGMDVSYYESSVDWVAARQAGIEFAFIRVTDGVQYLDPKFASYWAGAKAAGVIRGAYQFFRPAEDPIAQADLLLAKMGALEPGDLPPVIDVEVSGGLAPAQVAAEVRAWVDHVAEVTSKTVSDRLDESACRNLNKTRERSWLCIPEIIDWSRVTGDRWLARGRRGPVRARRQRPAGALQPGHVGPRGARGRG